MRQLYPDFSDDVDPVQVYDDPRRFVPADRPYVFVNMVSSADGGTVVKGVTEELGSPGDRLIFGLLRSLSDAILVGAGTVRNEGYGPPRVREDFRAARAQREQAELPRIAVVSNSLGLDWDSPLFSDERSRPFVLAPADADPARLEEARRHADVVAVGATQLDLSAALGQLAAHGVAALLCEGGPSLNGEMLAKGLIDELCLTISPNLVGGDGGARIMGRSVIDEVVGLRLASVLEEDGFLFLRYLVGDSSR